MISNNGAGGMVKTLTAILVMLTGAAAWAAEEITQPKTLHLCIACHGSDGIGRDPSWPNLAGQKTGYLRKQLRDFRADVRRNDMMQPLVVELTDADIDALAKYYSQLP